MNTKLKIIGMLAVALVFMGVGCTKASREAAQELAALNNTPSETYSWTEQGISFKYPEGMFIINNAENSLYINAVSSILPEGENALFYTRFDVLPNITIDKVVEIYKKNNTGWKSQETEKIGVYTFTKIQYNDNFTGEVSVHYLLAHNGRVLDYKVGGKEHAGNTVLTLSSLQL